MASALRLNLFQSILKMDHLFIKASVMDDLDTDIKRSIDDAVDESELLSFRYIHKRVIRPRV
jgi:hypothetical protein